jgi:hypothetical protein
MDSTNDNKLQIILVQKNPKELASQYTPVWVLVIGTPETPTLTTFNGVKAWQFSVNNDSYNIYIQCNNRSKNS